MDYNFRNRLLYTRVQAGDPVARDEMLELNMGFAMSQAHKLAERSKVDEYSTIDRDDLKQAAVEGVMRAMKSWDPDKGVFATYAAHWIRHYMQEQWEQLGPGLRTPPHVQYQVLKLRHAQEALHADGITDPTVKQLAKESGMSEDHVRRAQNVPSVYSYNRPAQDDENSDFLDLIVDENVLSAEDAAMENVERAEYAAIVRAELAKLPERQQLVVKMRIGFDGYKSMTLREVAAELDMSFQGVGLSEKAAFKRLREVPELERLAFIDSPAEAPVAPPAPRTNLDPTQLPVVPDATERTDMSTNDNAARAILAGIKDDVEREIAQKESEIVELRSGLTFLENRLTKREQ